MKVLRDGLTFYTELGDERAEVACEKKDKELHVKSTYTPEEHRGRGIATGIMKRVVEYAKEKELRIIPKCSFAVHYCKKNNC